MTLDFPKQSIEQARDVVSKYRKRYSDKKNMAAQLHAGKFLEIHYGFTDALKSGNCGRYLHEIERDADCFTMAGALYLVAREADLSPRLYLAQRINDEKEGELNEEDSLSDHTFLTVSVGKDKEYLVDPFMGAFGKVTFDSNRNRIKIYDPESKKITERSYSAIQELTEQEYIKRLEKNRTAEGGRIALSATQKVKGPKNIRVSVGFSPKTNEIKSSLFFPKSSFKKKPYKHKVYDLVTKVNDNGSFNFNNGTLFYYDAETVGWAEHIGPAPPLIYSAENALQFSKLASEIVKQTDRKSPIDFISKYKIAHFLKNAGLDNDFTIQPSSIAEGVVDNETFNQIQKAQEFAIDDYFTRVQEDELAFKNLLQRTKYSVASDNLKSPSNPEGLIFSEEDHQNLIKEAFEDYKFASKNVSGAAIRSVEIQAKLAFGSRYHSERDFNRVMGKSLKDIQYFTRLVNARDCSIKSIYPMLADRDLFDKVFEIEKASISDLQQGLTEQDIKKTAQKSLFNFLTGFTSFRRSLFLPSFQKGLERILKIK